MTIHYASDLHLEFPENQRWLQDNPLQGNGGLLLLAGDVMPFGGLDKYREQYARWGDQYDHVLWVPGNHEYYEQDITQRSGTLDEYLTSNVRLLNDTVWYAPGLRILCTTLWSRISPQHEPFVRRSMTDYEAIRYNGQRVHPAQITGLHEVSLHWLMTELATPFNGRTIVLTHHVPTLENYPAEFRGGTLTQAFAVELNGLIAASNISVWIYGHHHRNVPAFTIGEAHMLTNQLGYVRMGEDVGFDTNAHFELP